MKGTTQQQSHWLKACCLAVCLLTLAACDGISGFGFFSPSRVQYENSAGTEGTTGGLGQPLPRECTHRAAYAAGVADAKAGYKIDTRYGRDCPSDRATLDSIYRQGYDNGGLTRIERYQDTPRQSQVNRHADNKRDFTPGVEKPIKKKKITPHDPGKWHCFKDSGGAKVCGYYCQKSGGKVKCTESKTKRCVKNEKGDMACGYNCTASAKTVKCGYAPEQKCLSDAYGNIQCGERCQRVDGQVKCE